MDIFPELRIIQEARKLLDQYLPVTRTIPARSLSRPGMPVHLKIETDLPTSSFKPRGALYALAVNLARHRVEEVTASSTGNHGAAVAFAAKTMGVPATIFLPMNPNPVKRQKSAISVRELWNAAPAIWPEHSSKRLRIRPDPESIS